MKFRFYSCLLLISILGCQKSIEQTKKEVPALPQVSQGPSQKIAARVVYSEKVPSPALISAGADAKCPQDGSIKVDSLLVDATGGLAGAIVWIDDLPAEEAKDLAPLELVQEGCHYSPRVVALRAGQTLKIINNDQTMHNVHSQSKINPAFNDSQPPFHKVIEKIFTQPESPFPIKCDVHAWMGAAIFVAKNRFFAVTDANGHFVLNDVPAGSHVLKIWHERAGEKTVMISDQLPASISLP